ncbi:MAG: F0F1 ATP synthase subunit epsilon [Bacteroidaceae bacterium]|nr:F0F1 ATP synthase subunit epsilon [Bacteroidaceae bacterium]
MAASNLKLIILSPEKELFSGNVTAVSLPGATAPFTVLYNHAPIISVLERGTVRWEAETQGEVAIAGGFVEVCDNVVTACVETIK